jgi:hypothetical protein
MSGFGLMPIKLVDLPLSQQEAFIHHQAQDTQNIIFTNHVLKR